MDTAAAPRRLYKSRRNRFIDGICGGIAEYFQVDPTIVRLLWVLVTLLGGSGIILYIVGMIVIPVNPEHVLSPFPPAGATAGAAGVPVQNGGADKRRFFGILVMLLGVFFLVVNLGWFEDFSWWWFSRTVMLPVFMIVLGLIFVYTHTRKNRAADVAAAAAAQAPPGDAAAAGSATPSPAAPRELRRSLTDRKLFGVCGGLASYFGIDATIVRLVFVFMVIASFGWGLLLYILLGIIVQEERPGMAQGGRL